MDNKDTCKILILDSRNQESWFLQVGLKLKSKGIYCTIEKDKKEYAQILRANRPTIPTLPESKNNKVINDLTASFKRLRGI